MSKSKTNFNTFLKECEEYESIGTNGNGNYRQRHQHQNSTSTTSSTNNIGGITSTTGVISTSVAYKVSVNIIGDLLVGKQISVKIFVFLSCPC